MREIKFRAWDKENKIMYLAVTSIHWYVKSSGKKGLCGVTVTTPMGHDQFLPIEQTDLLEGTGLKDKNGKEIYEGDIVRLPDESLCDVRFSAGAFCLADKNSPAFHFLRSTLGGYCWKGEFKGEVIGNIYENPELLKAV